MNISSNEIALSALTGKTIWLLGASSDIGKALAHQLADAGNRVIASACSELKLNRLMARHLDQVKVLPIDVSCSDSIYKARIKLNQLVDYLDIVIYCTDGGEKEAVMDDVSFKKAMDENFLGLIRVLQLAKPILRNAKTQPQLAIINTLVSGLSLLHSQAYGAANAAMEYFTASMRADPNLQALKITSIKLDYLAAGYASDHELYAPLSVSKQVMASKIIQAIYLKKDFYDFPSRLYLFLRMVGCFKYAWLKWLFKAVRVQAL